MEAPDVQAGSSPAPIASLDPSDSLNALNETDLADWRLTGKLPDPKETPPAESSPATPEQAASTDALQPASEPAKPPKDKTAERFQELLADRAEARARAERLEKELAELRRPKQDATPAASSPAQATQKPDPEAFTYGTSDPAYLEALSDWKVQTTLAAERERWVQTQRQQQAEADARRIQDSWQTRIAEAEKKHADFKAVALEAKTEIQPGSLIDAFIWEHKTGAEVLYHLQSTPAELRRITALPLLDQIEALVLLGQRLTTEQPASQQPGAPSPPTTLATRATPRDPLERAIEEDDTAAYNELMNRREIARMKR